MAPRPTVVELREGYVRVAMFGRLETVEQARREQRAVEAACAQRGDRRVLFDNRGTEAPDEAVRRAMFEWAARFERAALLIESEIGAVATNMSALSQRASVRAFHDERAALTWLLR
jgi:hypothetical protein